MKVGGGTRRIRRKGGYLKIANKQTRTSRAHMEGQDKTQMGRRLAGVHKASLGARQNCVEPTQLF